MLPTPEMTAKRACRGAIQVHVYVRTCRFKSCFPHQKTLVNQGFFFLSTHKPPIPYPFMYFLPRFRTFPE